MAAEKANWGKRNLSKRSGSGIAANQNSLSYVATVVEIEVIDKADISIPRVDTVVDARTIANPELGRTQVEGAVVFGAGIVPSGQIAATNGAIDPSNFYDYRVTRISEAPYQTNVYFVDSDARPWRAARARIYGGLLQRNIRRYRQENSSVTRREPEARLNRFTSGHDGSSGVLNFTKRRPPAVRSILSRSRRKDQQNMMRNEVR